MKYRGSFLLESASTYWPWTHAFGRAHGSLPSPSPLLNFDPTWIARKPYACQACYSSDHTTLECSLPHMKLGGVPIVSHTPMPLIQHKKPAKRVVVIDRSLTPRPAPKETEAAEPIPAPRPPHL